MTTPTAQKPIAPVTYEGIGTTLPIRIIQGGGQGSVNVYNGDILNTLLVSPSQNPALTNSIPVQPLTNATVDGTAPQYAVALSGTVASCTVSGAGQMSPSPAQIAAQISALGLATSNNQATQIVAETATAGNTGTVATNTGLLGTGIALPVGAAKDVSVVQVNTTLGTPAQHTDVVTTLPANIAATGVPLLSLPTASSSQTTKTLAANTVVTWGPYNISQIGYDFFFSCYSNTPATATPVSVTINWIDSVSGVTCGSQTWWVLAGGNLANIAEWIGKGPVEANTVEIVIEAFAEAITYNYVMLQNSRVYARHDWRSLLFPGTFSGTLTSPSGDMPGLVFQRIVNAHASGANDTCILPLWAGRAYIGGHTNSNTNDMTLSLFDVTDQSITSNTNLIYRQLSDTLGNFYAEVALPRSMCELSMVNGNAAAETQYWTIVFVEY